MLFEPDLAIAARTGAAERFRDEVHAGLAALQRAIPARWLYDAAGSELFETITTLDEYYPFRTEAALIEANAGTIAGLAGPIGTIVEFGSGSSTKTPHLLRALMPRAYVPVDMAGEQLSRAAAGIAGAFPTIEVLPVEADFTLPISLPGALPERRLGFFPGSTIGNFPPAVAVDLLRTMGEMLGDDSRLLIGIDRVKDTNVLLPAYDDVKGVTARFNLNLLERINRELEGDIPVRDFRHQIRWNDVASRIEMHLVATEDVAFTVAQRNFTMAKDETIHTENSYKYGLRDAHMLLAASHWTPIGEWVDPQGLFMLILARREPPPTAP